MRSTKVYQTVLIIVSMKAEKYAKIMISDGYVKCGYGSIYDLEGQMLSFLVSSQASTLMNELKFLSDSCQRSL